MNIAAVHYDGSFGVGISEALRKKQQSIKVYPKPASVSWSEAISKAHHDETGVVGVALRGLRIHDLISIGSELDAADWIAVFPFERHLVVTPIFGPGRVCPNCFIKRWVSHPPAGYYQEVVSALISSADQIADFKYENMSPLAPALAASAMFNSVDRGARYALCLDQAGIDVESAVIRPVHGCSCRSTERIRGPERFVDFEESLYKVIDSLNW